MLALAVLPPASVTRAVMTYVPEVRLLTASVAPVPSGVAPAVQWMAVERDPSSTSLAVPARWIVSPGEKTEPVAGAVMATVGAAFTGMVMPALAVLPPAHVTLAGIVGVPEQCVRT